MSLIALLIRCDMKNARIEIYEEQSIRQRAEELQS